MKLAPEIPEVLPDIPAKRYFAIGEVADLCAVKPHVLRYWEQEFPQLKPIKRRGNRRYYLQDDVLMVRRIRGLLYEEGFTIGGARLRLKETAKSEIRPTPSPTVTASETAAVRKKRVLGEIRNELESLLNRWPL